MGPILDPTFDRTYYVVETRRRVRIVAHPDGEGYVFTYTSRHPADKEESDQSVPDEHAYFDNVLAGLGVYKRSMTAQAADGVFKGLNKIMKHLARKDLHEVSRDRGNVHSDTLFRHDTPTRIRERF